MTTARPGDHVVETVDRLDGTRVHDAVVTIDRVVRLTCGCHRLEANRPGGGRVHLIRGAHCAPPTDNP